MPECRDRRRACFPHCKRAENRRVSSLHAPLEWSSKCDRLSQIDAFGVSRYLSRPMGPLANFWAIVSVPDNIPIVFMLLLVGYFTYLSFDEARKNDRLIREGRKDQILRRMQD